MNIFIIKSCFPTCPHFLSYVEPSRILLSRKSYYCIENRLFENSIDGALISFTSVISVQKLVNCLPITSEWRILIEWQQLNQIHRPQPIEVLSLRNTSPFYLWIMIWRIVFVLLKENGWISFNIFLLFSIRNVMVFNLIFFVFFCIFSLFSYSTKQKNHKQNFIIVQQKIINYESARRIRWIDLVLLLRFCFVSWSFQFLVLIHSLYNSILHYQISLLRFEVIRIPPSPIKRNNSYIPFASYKD